MKEELINLAASKVHSDWCMSELLSFFKRLQESRKTLANPKDALIEAGIKNGKIRNEVIIDGNELRDHEPMSLWAMTEFNYFMKFINSGAIQVKRIKNGENILVPFENLSKTAKKENLDSAIGAYRVFEELSKCGVTIDEMKNNPELLNLIGMSIHTDWMKRNIETENQSLLVPYAELDEWTKMQDITVFKALLDVVSEKGIVIPKEEGFKMPDYQAEESIILEIIEEISFLKNKSR